jgi:hypothetical protein
MLRVCVEMSVSTALTRDNSRPWQTRRGCSLQSSYFKDIKRTIAIKKVKLRKWDSGGKIRNGKPNVDDSRVALNIPTHPHECHTRSAE